MGFSWTTITQYVTELAAAHQNEIKANVDIVYSDLDLSQYDWEYLPVSVDEENLHEHFKEMRDAVDYADDMNYCRSHDTGYNADDQAVHRATVYSSQKTGYDATHDVGVDGTYDSGVHSGEKSDYQASYNSGVDVGHDTTVYGDYNNGILSWHEATVKGDHKFTVYSSVNETYDNGFTP